MVVAADRTREVDKSRQPDTDAEAKMGYLLIHTTPYARVIIDDKDTGMSTPIGRQNRLSLKPGRHKVTFVVDGRKFDYPVSITAGQEESLVRDLPLPFAAERGSASRAE
jgi:hypothetical protein